MLVWAKASGSVQGDLHLQIFALQNFCFPTLAAVLCFFFISYIFFVFYQTTVEDVFFASKPSNVNLYLVTSREVCAGQTQQEKELPVPLMASKGVPVRCFPVSAEGAEFAGY